MAEPAERGGRGVLKEKKRDECMHHINATRWRRWRGQVTGHLTWPAGGREEGKGGENCAKRRGTEAEKRVGLGSMGSMGHAAWQAGTKAKNGDTNGDNVKNNKKSTTNSSNNRN